jgi:hypothetical protein
MRLRFRNTGYMISSVQFCSEATSLWYKHVVFRKPWCSATEISRVESVRNVEKKFCSCHNIHKGSPTLFFTMFHTQSTPRFLCSGTLVRETRCVGTLKMLPLYISDFHIQPERMFSQKSLQIHEKMENMNIFSRLCS